jgi:hypothetical protein
LLSIAARAAAGNTVPTTAREIAEALIADKATRKHAVDLQTAILVALRKRNGGMVAGEGARWRLKEAAN